MAYIFAKWREFDNSYHEHSRLLTPSREHVKTNNIFQGRSTADSNQEQKVQNIHW